jgi:hemolysin III
MTIADEDLVPMHASVASRYRSKDLAADRAIHIAGLSAGAAGVAALLVIGTRRCGGTPPWPIVVYAACLLTMLGCSAVYNLASTSPRRGLLRRLDHAAIFVMIAGTDTPFTIGALHGAWRLATTGSVWLLAAAGAFLKLRYPRRIQRVDLALYLGLGWIIIVAWKPMVASLDRSTAILIILGGVLYSIGTGFYAWRVLPFQKAIWHGFVLIAASCHYAAVMRLVLSPGTQFPNFFTVVGV